MAHGSLLLLLDVGLMPQEPEWLREMAAQAIRPGIGAVGAKLVARDGLVLHAGVALGGPDIIHLPYAGRRATDHGYFGHLQLVRSVSAVSASCLMLRRALFQEVGGLDETGLSAPLRDVDFCLKLAQHGYRNIWTPYAVLQCICGPAARNPIGYQQSARLLRQRWGRRLDSDPFWSPNLSVATAELGLAFPPWDQRPHALEAA
jgi:GT2 family glycosyltransferase